MEKQGCEIEALDIDYNIFVRKINVNPFGIFRRKPRPEADQPVKTEEESLKLEDETGNKVKHESSFLEQSKLRIFVCRQTDRSKGSFLFFPYIRLVFL